MDIQDTPFQIKEFIQAMNDASFQLNFIGDCKDAINQALEIISNIVNVDVITIYQNDENKNEIIQSTKKYGWSRSKLIKSNDKICFSSNNTFRWYESMQNGDPLKVSKEECPIEELEYLTENQRSSLLLVPIFISENFWGFMTLENHETNYKNWTEEEENLLFNFSFILGSRINRAKLESKVDFLKTVIEAIPNPLFVKDKDHRWVLMSDSNCKLVGIKKTEYKGKTDYDFLPKEQADVFWETDMEVLTTVKESSHEEYITDASNGQTKKIITRKKAIKSPDGEIYLVGSISDIVESKMTKDALAREENFLKALMDNIPDHIYFKDKQSRFLRINQAYLDKYGSDSLTKLIGKSDFDVFTKEHARQAYIDEQRIIRTGKPLIGIEERETLKNGSIRWVSTTKLPLYDSENHIIGTFGISRDITDRKMAEIEIQEKSQILNGIISNLPVIAYKVDSKGFFTESMGKGLKSMQYEDKQLVGESIYNLFKNDTEAIKKAYTEGFSNFISFGTNEGKEFYFENYLFKDISTKSGLIGFALEITDKTRSEHKLKEYALNLEKINKELDQFAYVVSHDLKAPLRAITNLSEWIEEDIGDKLDGDTKKNMQLLRGRVQRMQALINGILEYSRVSRTRASYEEVNIKNLICDLLGMLDVPEKFTVVNNIQVNSIITNRTRIEQVFSNLISNAVKYHNKPQGLLKLEGVEFKNHYEFSVSDDGPGIAPEFHEKIFVIFQTLESRDKVESTGVGLAIVKKIVEEEGGKIKVESNIGEGAKFIFTLPKIMNK
jgi:PAS domain S-box-containing protein